jgi:hypothetical protein
MLTYKSILWELRTFLRCNHFVRAVNKIYQATFSDNILSDLIKILKLSRISGSHVGEYEDGYLLGCSAV